MLSKQKCYSAPCCKTVGYIALGSLVFMTVPLLSPAMDKPEWLTGMEAVLEVLNEGVVITNEHQQILSVDSRFTEMTGISRGDLSGSYASQFYSPQERDFVTRQIDAGSHHGHNPHALVLLRKHG